MHMDDARALHRTRASPRAPSPRAIHRSRIDEQGPVQHAGQRAGEDNLRPSPAGFSVSQDDEQKFARLRLAALRGGRVGCDALDRRENGMVAIFIASTVSWKRLPARTAHDPPAISLDP